jgi:hypothetical protein
VEHPKEIEKKHQQKPMTKCFPMLSLPFSVQLSTIFSTFLSPFPLAKGVPWTGAWLISWWWIGTS